MASESRDVRTSRVDRRLERVAIDLATATTRDEIAIVLLRDGVPALGASTGALCLLDPTATVVEMVATAGYGPEARDAWSRFPLDADLPASEVIRTGHAIFLRSAEERDARYPAFATAPVVEAGAWAILPLLRDGRPFGCVAIGYSATHDFTPHERRVFEAVVTQSAIALERIDADESAAETFAQLQFLVEASATLASSLDYASTLARVADIAVPRLADFCTVHLMEGDEVALVAAAHTDADRLAYLRELHTRYPIDPSAPAGAGAALAKGRVVVSPAIDDEMLREVARDEEHLSLLRAGFAASVLAVPLLADGRPFGVIVLGNDRGRMVTRAQQALAEALAGRAALAIERARLFEAERAARTHAEEVADHLRVARDRLAFLAEASATLAASLDYDETLRLVVGLSVPRFADSCAVYELDRRRVHQIACGPDPAHATTANFATSGVDDARVAAVIARGAPHIDIDSGAAIVMPLVAGGAILGAIAFVRSVSGRRFDADDIELAAELARRAAVAIDNARVHRTRTEVADILQRSLRPPTLPTIAGVELAAAYCPTGDGIEAGGDFYDVFAPAPGRWSLVVGDVCGTGAAAGAVTAQVRHTLRAEARHAHDVIGVVAAVNDVLVESGRDESFCTLIYGELTISTRGGIDIEIVAAGHPQPFVVHAGDAVDVPVSGLLLGVIGPFVGQPVTVHLDPGDALVILTDGVLEARVPDDRTRMFGRDGVRAAIESGSDAAELAGAIERSVRGFAGDAVDDDMAILVVRAEPAGDPAVGRQSP